VILPEIYNLGTVGQDEEHSAEFELRNTTDELISVLVVAASCNCSNPELESRILLPGSRSMMRVRYRTNQRHGSDTTGIALRYRVGATKYFDVRVAIRSEIIPDYLLEPPHLTLVKNQSEAVLEVRGGKKLFPGIRGVTCTSSNATIRVLGNTVRLNFSRREATDENSILLVELNTSPTIWLRVPVKVDLSEPNTQEDGR
jgi:hypothetical protein